MRLFGARHKRLSAPDFSRILISSRNHCKSSKKFARPGTDDARRKLKPLMNTDEHEAAQPQPKNERLRTHWRQVWSSAFRLHWTEQAKARTPNLTAQVVRKNRSAGVSPASEPRQLLLGQHDLCRLEAGDTFFLTTTEGTEISQSNQAATKNFTAETLVVRKNWNCALIVTSFIAIHETH